MTVDVRRELRRRAIPPRAVLLERLHHDPVEIAAKLRCASFARRRSAGAARRRVGRRRACCSARRSACGGSVLADACAASRRTALAAASRDRTACAGEQLVEQHAERIDVACACRRRARSSRPAPGSCTRACRCICSSSREERLVGQPLLRRLGDAEVDDLRDRPAVLQRDQDVRRLQVAVDDRLSDARAAPRRQTCMNSSQPLAQSAGCARSQ